jgi:two-component system, NarL family, sensor histidine kinase UhpB
MSLFGRVFATNAALLVVAALVLGLSPVTVSWPIALTEAIVLVVGLIAMLGANLFLLRPVFAPLHRLASHMRAVDLLRPGQRVAQGGPAEVVSLVEAFNDMLDRLEHERRTSGRRAIAAQEAERRRVATELHDEIGQMMTAVLMRLERLRDGVRPDRIAELNDAQESVRGSLEDVRRIAQELRPETLEHLGLSSAVHAMCDSLSTRTGLDVVCDVADPLPTLDPETELAVYRIAQEALTNVVRHAEARHAWLAISPRRGGIALRVSDDGRGMDGTLADTGGLRGMRERAVTVGGDLTIASASAGGVEVSLMVPPGSGAPPP